MIVFLTAVLTASLLGSMHCVGMCGPLAIFASGAGGSNSRSVVAMSTACYHLGRLVTYLIAGLIAGWIGGIVDAGGQTLGFQLAAARLVGSLMIAIGIIKIVQLFVARVARTSPVTQSASPSLMSRFLVRLRPFIFSLPPTARALMVGMLTTLLPCGWLYLFALVAAGTGSVISGPLVMFSFWLGTVPALTALISGTVALSSKFRTIIPTAAASLLIFAGIFTFSGRGFANLQSLDDLHPVSSVESIERSETQLDELLETPLPCCQEVDES